MFTSAKTELGAIKTNLNAIAETIYRLKDRWSDEKDYEDFAEYIKVVEDTFAKFGVKAVKVTKQFKITTMGGVSVHFTSTGVVKMQWLK